MCGKTQTMKLTKIAYGQGWLYVEFKPNYCIKEGELYYKLYPNKEIKVAQSKGWGDWQIIVAQSTNLSIPNIPYIEVKDDIEKLAEIEADKEEWDFESHEGNGYNDFVNGFTRGYKAAQSKIEADLGAAFEAGEDYGRTSANFHNTDSISRHEYESTPDGNDYIQSLNQPIEVEMQVEPDFDSRSETPLDLQFF